MQPTQQQTNTQDIIRHSGRWITERQFAEIHSIPKASLANWRFRDRVAQRNEALPGYPRYRRFGRAVRYWMPAETA
jgi:hypothetical protein